MSKTWLQVVLYEPARKEILDWPLEIRKDLGSILTRIQKGDAVDYPDVESIRTVSIGCFEIRLKGAEGIFRVFYVIRSEWGILVFHGFKKKSQKTPRQEIETGQKRLTAFIKELQNEED